MTTNIQLEDYLKRHKAILGNQIFLGVFPSDELPKNPQVNSCLIVNYSPEKDSGTHWVAMRMLGTRIPQYFDSYGLPPDAGDPLLTLHTGFKEYLRENSTSGDYIYNTFDLQSWKQGEDECGEYAVWFIMHGEPNISNPAWAPYIKEQDGLKRDQMIRRRLGIIKG